MTFEGKTVLVTGAGRGIGKAIGLAFLKQAARVGFNDLLPEEEMLAALGKQAPQGSAFMALRADVRRPEEVQKMIHRLEGTFGSADILVNNAGIIRRGDIGTVTHLQWEEVIDVNLTGAFNCCRAVVEGMKQKGCGCIVNVSSVAAKTGDITSAPGYGPSKAGLDALTKSLARQLASYGIRVNGVAPHAIETDMSAEWSAEKRKAVIAAIPLGRLGKPEEVAEAVLFLASEKAAFITGEILDVNGGFIMD